MPSEPDLDAIFAALADPTRRAILSMLLEDDMAVTDVAAPFGISLAAISKHLATLASAGLIQQERRGRITWCKLDPEGMRPAAVWMRGSKVVRIVTSSVVSLVRNPGPDSITQSAK